MPHDFSLDASAKQEREQAFDDTIGNNIDGVRIEYQAGKAKVQERGVAKQQEQHR